MKLAGKTWNELICLAQDRGTGVDLLAVSTRPGAEYIFMSTSTNTLIIDEYEYIAKS